MVGQIHDNCREEVEGLVIEKDLPFSFVSPQTNHDISDNMGGNILGKELESYFKDNAASEINNFLTADLMNKADIVIAFFGEDFRQ